MQTFLSQSIEKGVFELEIDTHIFSKDIILKAVYNFLDKGYLFFRFDEHKNIILQCSLKQEKSGTLENLLRDFGDELLDVYLRDRLEQDNKIIREIIIKKALLGPFDLTNFVTLDTDKTQKQNEIDFDKDIDDILKEIENGIDLKIDEVETQKILAEIEAESKHIEKPSISIDPSTINKAKDMSKNK